MDAVKYIQYRLVRTAVLALESRCKMVRHCFPSGVWVDADKKLGAYFSWLASAEKGIRPVTLHTKTTYIIW